MDERIPRMNLRIFNPGWIFLVIGLILSRSTELLRPAAIRAKRTLLVFFCMTFIVQQLKYSGSISQLMSELHPFLLRQGAPFLGWLGSAFIGTATVANLFMSPLIEPLFAGALATGTAIGVQLTFQSIIGVKSILRDQISEREILKYLLPISVFFVAIALLFAQF